MRPNFNPQTDLPPVALLNVSQSPYAQPLETVAPGITGLINQTRAADEEWPRTLVRLVSSIEATDEQRQILLDQAQRADAGLPPAGVPDAPVTVTAAATGTPTIPPLLKWGGIAAAAWLLLG